MARPRTPVPQFIMSKSRGRSKNLVSLLPHRQFLDAFDDNPGHMEEVMLKTINLVATWANNE